jgi:hypothetical protein
MKHVQRFGAKRKLAPRYVGPYQVIERKGDVAQTSVARRHKHYFLVLHVSQLKKYLRVLEERVEAKALKIGSDLVYCWGLVLKCYESRTRQHREY